MKFTKNYSFFKKQHKILLSFLSAFVLICLFLNNHKNITSVFSLIKSNAYSTFGRIKNINNACSIPLIKKVPENSVIVIGHAYGKPLISNEEKIRNNFIAPKVTNFLEKNQKKINTVIFTGDVFLVPSSKKWIKLKDLYSKKFKILIAPGNHDLGIGRNNYYQDIYSNIIEDLDSYPLTFNYSLFNFVIENSNNNINMDEKKLFKLIDSFKNSSTNKTILFRHHIPIKELKYLSNNRKIKGLPSFRDLEKKLNNNNLIIISGDGGAAGYLQRIGCLQFNSIKYIVNGLGGIDEDRVIVIDKMNIYQMRI